MAAATFSRDVLEMFYGPIPNEVNERLRKPIRPLRRFDFQLARNDFNQWLRVWKMSVPGGNRDLLKFFQKTKPRFIEVCKNEVKELKSVKMQFGLLVRFSMNRDEEVRIMEHYFNRMQPAILNEHNIDTLNFLLNQFIDEVKGEIEAWSQRGSGWVVDEILETYINVARYQPLRGGSYMVLPSKLKNKKAILNIQNRDNQCLRWAIRAALFPAPKGRNPIRTSSYPTEDGLDFEGIDFPTPVKQIDRLEKQNPNLAINVFGWEKERVIVHRITEKGFDAQTINLMITTQGENTHYSYVKRLTALLHDQSRYRGVKHFCERCLHGYTTSDLLERHKPECKGLLKTPTRTEMPKEGENKMTFTNHHKQMKSPYVVYADFECVLKKIEGCHPAPNSSYTVKTEKHEPCSFSYIAVRSDGKGFGPYTYRGEDAVYMFLVWLQNHEREMREDMAKNRPLVMTPEDWKNHRQAVECHICNKALLKDLFLDSVGVHNPYSGKYCGQSHRRCFFDALKNLPKPEKQPKDKIDQWIANNQETCLFCADPLLVANYKDSVRDHDHLTGRYRGAAHNDCNFKLKMKPKTAPIPVFFHNLKGYDGHLLMQAMARVQGEIKCIPTNTEKYISFSLGNLRFVDSVNFLLSSLDKLVKGSDEFPILQKIFPQENKMLVKKGIYPYEYMDSFEKFEETELPEKEKFYSSLCGKGITDEEYHHAQEVWEKFKCQNLGDYHDLYVTTDALLLADVFENLRKVCQEKYGLDPAHYYNAPGLSWDALLKKTGVELDLLTDLDMHLFIERGMRGGISMVSKRYAKANNPLVEGYNPNEPTNYIAYLDANNLYGWAMSLPLPKSNFHWKRVMPTEEQITKMKWNSKKGWMLEVDIEYPAYLHDLHNDYPLAPEKKMITPEQMSGYQRRLMADLDLTMPATEKLVLTLEDKEKYVVHYKNLQFYLRQGMRLKKVHRVLEFDQEPWMEPYIRMNTEFRKQAKTDFETDFYKLMNNSVFGKTMENLRNRTDVKIVRSWETDKIRKLVSSPSYDRYNVFGNDMAGIHMRKTRLVLNKPVYTGMAILENSKILMYDFFHNHLKARYVPKCELIYTDTDSLLLNIQTEDVYKDMKEDLWMYDTSNYPKDHPLYDDRNKKVLGKMKASAEAQR